MSKTIHLRGFSLQPGLEVVEKSRSKLQSNAETQLGAKASRVNKDIEQLRLATHELTIDDSRSLLSPNHEIELLNSGDKGPLSSRKATSEIRMVTDPSGPVHLKPGLSVNTQPFYKLDPLKLK